MNSGKSDRFCMGCGQPYFTLRENTIWKEINMEGNKKVKPKYNLFESVIYIFNDSGGGGYSVGRIENISSDGDNWRYYFHNNSSCIEDDIKEKLGSQQEKNE